jgi:hypothetical protein
MTEIRFSNETSQPLEFMVEPWGTVEIIQPGSKFVRHCPAPDDQPDTSLAKYHEGMIQFWCAGSTYEIDIDGVRIVT